LKGNSILPHGRNVATYVADHLFPLSYSLTLSEVSVTQVTNNMFFFFSWNEAYLVEKKNFNEYGDVGEVWFGEDSALRIVR
jgi:hypothetical protein